MEQISSGRNHKLENMCWVSKEREFASPEQLTLAANVNIKTPHFHFTNYLTQNKRIRKNSYKYFEVVLELENMLWFIKGNHRARLKHN